VRHGRFTHKTTQVCAVQFDGSQESRDAIQVLVDDVAHISATGLTLVRDDGNIYRLTGGDWVIRRDSGCVYTCSNESFENNYEVD
jgi:hypothetical protein